MNALVWWCDEWKVWGVTLYDNDGNQASESEWHALKDEASNVAHLWLHEGSCNTVTVERKDGVIHYTRSREDV
jgi:hypothetical protein